MHFYLLYFTLYFAVLFGLTTCLLYYLFSSKLLTVMYILKSSLSLSSERMCSIQLSSSIQYRIYGWNLDANYPHKQDTFNLSTRRQTALQPACIYYTSLSKLCLSKVFETFGLMKWSSANEIKNIYIIYNNYYYGRGGSSVVL